VSSLPKSVLKRSFFLVDLNKFDFRDMLSDDNGSYTNNGQPSTYYKVGFPSVYKPLKNIHGATNLTLYRCNPEN
jgi:hypothetical protein